MKQTHGQREKAKPQVPRIQACARPIRHVGTRFRAPRRAAKNHEAKSEDAKKQTQWCCRPAVLAAN